MVKQKVSIWVIILMFFLVSNVNAKSRFLYDEIVGMSKGTEMENNIDFSRLPDGDVDHYEILVYKDNIRSYQNPSGTYTYSSSYTIDKENVKVYLDNPESCTYSSCYEKLIGKYVKAIKSYSWNSKDNNEAVFYITNATSNWLYAYPIEKTEIYKNNNGWGVYMLDSTKNDKYPIYFFRGNTAKNVLFADYCWTPYRTTNTGGVKMVYRGVPKVNAKVKPLDKDEYINIKNEDEYPFEYLDSEKMWKSAQFKGEFFSTMTFNLKNDGDYYLYYDADAYGLEYLTVYVNGKFKGTDTDNSGIFSLGKISQNDELKITYREDCRDCGTRNVFKFSISKLDGKQEIKTTCENYDTSASIGAITYSDWDAYENIDNAYLGYMYGEVDSNSYDKAHDNIHDSNVKSRIDKWFEESLLDYTDYLEDTTFCNDRTMTSKEDADKVENQYYSQFGFGNNYTLYSGYKRALDGKPTLECSPNDSFSVKKENGNGKLKYPIGLLTLDESILAGAVLYEWSNTNALFYNGINVTMTPLYTDRWSSYLYVDWFGEGMDQSNIRHMEIRPVISVKGLIIDGDGSFENPFVLGEYKEEAKNENPFKETIDKIVEVVNPETIDNIGLIIILFIISFVIFLKFRKKYKN